MKMKDELVLVETQSIALKKTEDGVERTSNLMAPIMMLEGHSGEIYSVEFHPEGRHLASAGYDRQIFIWNVYGECENIGTMTGHTGAIMELHFSTDGNDIFTCSTDCSLGMWDLETGKRVKKFKGHESFVNSCRSTRRGQVYLCSGSDDCSIKIWDPRQKNYTTSLNNTYQVTAVTFDDTAQHVISGGIDNDVKVWDIRANNVHLKLRGHIDTVTGISLSADGSYILSNAMDNTLRVWDIRPYAPADRCVKIFTGHQHNFEKNLLRAAWSPDGQKISAGSADRYLYIWDTTTRRILYKLPGHNGSVNDVDFHPTEPIVVSAASDKVLYMGELTK